MIVQLGLEIADQKIEMNINADGGAVLSSDSGFGRTDSGLRRAQRFTLLYFGSGITFTLTHSPSLFASWGVGMLPVPTVEYGEKVDPPSLWKERSFFHAPSSSQL